MSDLPLVSISCSAYNHASYIRQCLDGFMMQKCNFIFEVLIHDDASTDETADIIREYEAKYPNIIKPIYQTENQYQNGRGIMRRFNYPRAKGKYIALCEGDDYWTDPNKLQRQVDFLEANPEYSITSHRFNSFDDEKKEWLPEQFYYPKLLKGNPDGISFDMEQGLFRHWLVKTLTVVFRKDMLDQEALTKYKYSRDFHLCYHLLQNGKGYYFNYVGGIYRLHENGVHSKIEKEKRDLNTYNLYSEFYTINKNSLSNGVKIATLSEIFYYKIKYQNFEWGMCLFLLIQYLLYRPKNLFFFMRRIYGIIKMKYTEKQY